MRAPDWFIAVNPSGWNDPEDTDSDINDDFAATMVDARLVLANGDMEVIKQRLWKLAENNAEDNYLDDAGVLFAAWTLTNGRVLVAVMDNGGSVIKMEHLKGTILEEDQVIKSGIYHHFDAQKAVDPEYYSGQEDTEVIAELIKLLWARH